MPSEDMVTYLANVLTVARADGKLEAGEQEAMSHICRGIGAQETHMQEAIRLVQSGGQKIKAVGRFSDKVRNLEDMICMSVSDGELPAAEKKLILSFAKAIHVTQEQVNQILSESKDRLDLQRGEMRCDACKEEIPPGSKFCPFCGCQC